MLSFALALAAMVQTDAINSARQAYSTCLRQHVNTSLERNVPPDTFERDIAGQCTDRATAFRDALVQRDVRAGGGRSRAEEDARITMEDMRLNYTEMYRDEVAAAAPRPQAPSEPEAEAPEAAETPQ